MMHSDINLSDDKFIVCKKKNIYSQLAKSFKYFFFKKKN